MLKELAITSLFLAAPALADDNPARTLRVVNDTSSAVNQLFVSGERTGGLRAKVSGILGPTDGDRDRLDAKMLPRGGTIVVELKGKRCNYDLRAVMEDGRSYVADDFDVCARSTWAIASGRRR